MTDWATDFRQEPRSVDELRDALIHTNQAEERLANQAITRFSSPQARQFRSTMTGQRALMGLGLPTGEPPQEGPQLALDSDSASGFAELLAGHPAVRGGRHLSVGTPIFGVALGHPFSEGAVDAAAVLVLGALALGRTQRIEPPLVDALVHIGLGATAVDTIFRRGLLGHGLLWDPSLDPAQLPDLADLEWIGRQSCVAGILDALHSFGREIAGAAAQDDVTFRAHAIGISGLIPSSGRAGDTIVIQGSGFGLSPPPDTTVQFPRAGSGCAPVLLAPVQNPWTDTAISVKAPERVGDGAVGFVVRSGPETGPAPTGEGASQLAGELEGCLGPAVAHVAERVHHWMPHLAPTPCPGLLPLGENHFHGGPVIVNVSSAAGKRGDTITVTGLLFAASDAAYLEGEACPTTAMSATSLTFTVPLTSGGRRSLTVRHSPTQFSNSVEFRVLPTLESLAPTRASSGDLVTLIGSGFTPGMSVRLNGVSASAIYSGPGSASFICFRPANVNHDPAGESLTVVAVQADGKTTDEVHMTLDTYRIVVFGDSVAWGQGLTGPDKWSSLVATEMRSRLGVRKGVYNEDVAAHSGATIGLRPLDTNAPGPLPDGEVPTSYPTLSQQVDPWNSNPALAKSRLDVDLVLIDGGINDIGITSILAPWTFHSWIKTQVQLQCHDAMKDLLLVIAGTFPRATIIVTGYYPMVSDKSDTILLTEMLVALGVALGAVNGALIGGVISPVAKALTVANCDVFASEANAQLQLAVNEVNTTLATSRVALAVPAFGERNAALAPDTWTYGINVGIGGVTPEDPLAASRAASCAATPPARQSFYCEVASMGHPNTLGAHAYLDAIKPHI
jgi:IPT/TIG domain